MKRAPLIKLFLGLVLACSVLVSFVSCKTAYQMRTEDTRLEQLEAGMSVDEVLSIFPEARDRPRLAEDLGLSDVYGVYVSDFTMWTTPEEGMQIDEAEWDAVRERLPKHWMYFLFEDGSFLRYDTLLVRGNYESYQRTHIN